MRLNGAKSFVVGAEYKPLSGTEAGLGWLREAEGQGSAAA